MSLVGAQVKLNAGGSAGSGQPAQPLLPSLSQGGRTEASHQVAPKAPPPEAELSASQSTVARTARELGASRCPVCEACMQGSCDL